MVAGIDIQGQLSHKPLNVRRLRNSWREIRYLQHEPVARPQKNHCCYLGNIFSSAILSMYEKRCASYIQKSSIDRMFVRARRYTEFTEWFAFPLASFAHLCA